MEAHALNPSGALAGRSPLLRLQSDERLIALIRRGHHGAFDALFQRYQSRLLAFCRHMLGSTEDAEDVLQEVFTAAFNAMLADERPINARPWLYRIARNRCLNHLRKPSAAGLDSMDVFERDGGVTTADTVHRREEFRQIVADVQDLPETQRTALLLREIDALSYDQIAEAMDTTVPSVKSLLVRARVSLAEAAEARLLTCSEVRLELGQVAEGITKTTAPVRRHLKHCERCRLFRSELRRANRALAAVYPIGLLVLVKKLFLAKVGSSAVGSSLVGGGAGAAGGAAGGAAAGGALSAGIGAVASKAVAGLAAVTIVTAGAVEVNKVTQRDPADVAVAPAAIASTSAADVAAAPQPAPPQVAAKPAQAPADEEKQSEPQQPAPDPEPEPEPAAIIPVEPPAEEPPAEEPDEPIQAGTVVDEDGSTTTLPDEDGPVEPTEEPGEEEPPPPPPAEEDPGMQQTQPTTPPGEARSTPEEPQPAPVAGEPEPRSAL
ncbi:MAG TPA: sigma-70 family RNA polymerase sigma factor [Thermoleophilaceae bacterium]|nr:sigma-70 family RNA polymerase sigma factor [Thermoleophilaceae bacterium]